MVFSALPRFVSLELKNKLFKHQVFYKSVGKPDAFVCLSSDVKNTPGSTRGRKSFSSEEKGEREERLKLHGSWRTICGFCLPFRSVVICVMMYGRKVFPDNPRALEDAFLPQSANGAKFCMKYWVSLTFP